VHPRSGPEFVARGLRYFERVRPELEVDMCRS
jgi:hypothetical protein